MLQSSTKYLRQTLVQEKFDFYFSGVRVDIENIFFFGGRLSTRL